MGISAAELAEAPAAAQEQPEGKKLAGRSPTRIAMDRLRKDKLAVVCTVIVSLMVIAAILAPVICHAMKIYPTTESLPYQP
jgi:hypothetical protein